jgi:hypothetical protein
LRFEYLGVHAKNIIPANFLQTRSISRPRCGLSPPCRLGADSVAESGNWMFNQHLRSRKNEPLPGPNEKCTI